MAATIKIKNSSTAGAAPTASDLVQGELAVNVTDKRLYTENSGGTIVELGTNPSVPVTFPDGSASAPSLTNDGDTNTGIFFPAADTVGITTGGTERVRVDSSGNMGLGVTPSAWNSSSKVLQLNSSSGGTGSIEEYVGQVISLNQNGYRNSSASWVYVSNNYATQYYQYNGQHVWQTAASGTAGNAITFTQAMTLDASGNLGVGTTSPSQRLTIAQTNGYPVIDFKNSGTGYGDIGFQVDKMVLSAYSTTPLTFWTNSNERARIDSSGNLLVGVTSSSVNHFSKNTAQGNGILFVDNTVTVSCRMYSVSNEAYNAAATAMNLGRNSSTSRSINAAGTVNASGADYAEYMTKAGSFTIAKGDVIGINAEGKLTNVFADAVSFCVKSTDPSYVGGDVWGSAEALGLTNPEQPIKREATENKEAETDEEFAIRQAQYETDKAAFESALEVARQKVDRIAFAGQVPVNVTGATAGQYIVPTNSNGAIIGVAVNEADMTLSQYMKTVGKVIAIEQDGRAKIIVKVA